MLTAMGRKYLGLKLLTAQSTEVQNFAVYFVLLIVMQFIGLYTLSAGELRHKMKTHFNFMLG